MRPTKTIGLLFSIILCLTFTSAQAETDIGFYGIGGKLGYVMPEGDIENTFGLGVQADLGTITEQVHLDAFVDFWSKGYDAGDFEWSWTNINIGAMAKYYFPVSGNLNPYAGGGLGFAIGMWKTEYSGPANSYLEDLDESDTEIDIALHLAGGAEMELSPLLDGFFEVKYTISEADYFGFWLGVMYKLGE
jgi:opacity protein-like surface antigen